MTKLTLEQREELADMVESGTWNSVLALCQISIEHHENRLATADISKGDRDLVLCKARLEGAKDMQQLFTRIREHTSGIKKKV